jgi:copper chaperone CopZ
MNFKYITFYICLLISSYTFGQVNQKTNLTDTTFKVFGVCEQCKDRIEGALKLKGISKAVWDIDSKLLSLQFDAKKISLDKIENTIVAVGHDLVNKKAKDYIYQDLPECCLYRELETHHDDLPQENNNLAQITGVVVQEGSNGKFEPFMNASVYWAGTKTGVRTDSFGVFKININPIKKLVISYVGFKSDTITIENVSDFKVVLAAKNQINEVTVFSRNVGSFIPLTSTIRTQVMTGTELLKAACCNLSESFETNPSVDVSFNDAVTGSKQIQLLGLSGNYTQLTIENLPGPRGIATILSLNSIAGPWIESIQLTKGVGSVANGYESIAGQINVELKKPETAEKLLANIYVNDFGKTDLNLNLSHKLNSKWSTTLLLHDDFLNNKNIDFNKDEFRDLPTGNQFSLVNRFKYDNPNGFLTQFGYKILDDQKIGGQTTFDPSIHKGTTHHYGLGINTKRYEVFGKIGYIFPQQKYKSIGLQLNAINHDQDSYFGLTNYKANQKSFYGNLIYQSIFNSTIHKYRTGLSFQLDQYDELFNLSSYKRKEVVPGMFFEYTYTPNDKLSMIMGLRADNNNLFGTFTTPRFNLRYELFRGSAIRLSAGRGQRTANIFAENNSILVSARGLEIHPTNTGHTMNMGGAYGLSPEIAWNKGISFDQKFILFNKSATLGIDFFRNDFENQVVVDLENPRKVIFTNLTGKSFSNSFQVELNTTPLKRFDVKLAYRYFDVKQTYHGVLLERPYIAKHRSFLSFDYATLNSWKFNYTITYNGAKRIPNTYANPTAYRLPSYSPSYILMNAQISKTFGNTHPMDLYVGSENISNFFQTNAIIAADNPFNSYFDASMIWGPTSGRMIYFGWRYKIK